MKVIRISSAQEAVLCWLTAELDSARFSGDLHKALNELNCSEKIITNADLHDASANAVRWQILKNYRTWLDRDFEDYEWNLVELDQDDVASLNYIDYSYWNELSDNTHKVGRAARNITNSKVVFDVPNDNYYFVAKDVESGKDFAPIIVVSNNLDEQGEILEGHVRATGYALSQKPPKPLSALCGLLR